VTVLSKAGTPIERVLPFFTSRSVDVCFLVPTLTGIEKSIIDATASVRQFLAHNEIHDFERQKQGTENKVLIPAYFVAPDRLIETKASLYRPVTKKGDPRIWFQKLKTYAVPYNLLGIVTNGESLIVFNLSHTRIIDSLEQNGFCAQILDDILKQNSSVAIELLEKLKRIYRRGFIDTVVSGDTGIGMTLENLLGIPPNSSTAPDYKGIELKASRANYRTSNNRVNLFSRIPDWKNSKIKSAVELLNTYGYVRDGRLQLYCTVSSNPNSQGLFFDVDDGSGLLLNKNQIESPYGVVDVVQWELQALCEALEKKHKETFWVKATSQIRDGIESFQYEKVVHTRRPNSRLFSVFIEESIITMDYLLHMEGTRARDHGFLFKIKPNDIGLLFPEPKHYDLSE
jgi:hypothetical protein